MGAFPILSRSPGASGYVEELNTNAVEVASKASGLPVVNKLFTFNPKTFRFTLNLVSQADKETILDHYTANCDVPFDWDNEQDGEKYEVIYARPPDPKLDKLRTRWKIILTFIQYSPLV
jgi:hypothetical protein